MTLSVYIWYYLSGVKFGNLPSASFTSPGFSKFTMVQDTVETNFLVSGQKLSFMRKIEIK